MFVNKTNETITREAGNRRTSDRLKCMDLQHPGKYAFGMIESVSSSHVSAKTSL